tara:strand:- start:42742 stop:42945 length:204 start_codon:yes stop_codon:yes gene_type:complete
MADQINTTNTPEKSGGNGIAFVVGILVVVVGILAYVIYGGSSGSDGGDINVTVEGAADAVEGAVTPE